MMSELLTRGISAYKRKGLAYLGYATTREAYRAIKRPILLEYYRTLQSSSKFEFRGQNYSYLYTPATVHWPGPNERSVEVPIFERMVRDAADKRILEVGNVLHHHMSHSHDVVDKYEKADGVWNEDAVDFRGKEAYDLIVSISTLEHVGFDEPVIDAEKIPRAFANLKSNLKPGGLLVASMPVGYNAALDHNLREGILPLSARYCLKRISANNKWIETNWDEIKNAAYDKPYPFANALVIVEVQN